MPEIEIRNVTIDFPYEPYDIQKDYMEKVIECLQTKTNGVLESPTGTGKTLSLLCSSLAWLCATRAASQIGALSERIKDDKLLSALDNKLHQQSGGSSNSWNEATFNSRKVVYASRTHSQLNQVMLELKKTAYRHVKVGILGSRDQLCIHPKVSKEPSTAAKIHMCKMLTSSRSCPYYNNVDTKLQNPLFQEDRLVDIEDLIMKGKKTQCCPYYASRELQNDANILFTPYNYLLDSKTRRTQDMRLSDNVVILDEAHNVEKVCEEASSSNISSTTIAFCITEITSVMKLFHSEVEQSSYIETNLPKDFTAEELVLLKTIFIIIEKAIDEIELPDKKSRTFPGSYIFDILKKAEITPGTMFSLLETLNKVCQFLLTVNDSQVHQKGNGLSRFSDFLEVVFNSLGPGQSTENTDLNFKLHVEVEIVRTAKGNSWSSTSNVTEAGGKVLNFWCFNPGFGMRALLHQGVHCVILTSGTLSPLAATISEIGIPVGVQLCNQHIIKPNQISAVVVEKGPASTELKCVYTNRSNGIEAVHMIDEVKIRNANGEKSLLCQKRDANLLVHKISTVPKSHVKKVLIEGTNQKYLADLGQTCLNFYRTIPGGVLVFFPSYPFLKSCMEFWQENGTWNRMAAVKSIFVEPQNKEELKTIMEEYYKMVNERGASLLAVCRGKVSEGLDFTDARARAVLVMGLPYPPLNDPKVVLKREYLDNGKRKKTSSLDGNEWYQLEAMRAVNQAIGRVIRHGKDHGAIIFCDCRFSNPNNIKSLSHWLQSHIKPRLGFGPALRIVNTFFKSWKDIPNYVYTIDTGNPPSISYQSGHVLPAQKLAPAASSASSSKVDLKKFYENSVPCSSKTLDPPLPNVKRKSFLEDLENSASVKLFDDETPISAVQMLPTEKKSEVSIPLQQNVKKRKLHIIPVSFNSTAKETFSIVKFTEKLQKNLTKEQMNEFKTATSQYRCTNDCENFIVAMSTLFLPGGNIQLHAMYKDISHLLKTEEHRQQFWKAYDKNINKYK